jgi:hypothetical protein
MAHIGSLMMTREKERRRGSRRKKRKGWGMTRSIKSICPAPLLVDASAESSKLPLCFLAAMDQFISELPQIEVSNGGPWLWQVRRFQDNAVVILREIRGQRLQSGRYPTRQEHTSTCDAGILVEIIENWDCGWQVPYVVLQIAADGLYSHPDVRDLAVEGVRVASYVDEVLEFVNGVGTPWASSRPRCVAVTRLRGRVIISYSLVAWNDPTCPPGSKMILPFFVFFYCIY